MKKKLIYLQTFKMIFLFLAAVVALNMLVSCGKGDSGQNDSDYFIFDKSMTGIEVVDQELGLKFHPPVNWQLQQTSISKKIEARDSANPNDHFIYLPTYVFFDASTGGFLSVGKVLTSDTSMAKSTQMNFFKGLISSKHKNDNLISENFVHSKIYFSQFKIEKYDLVSFKLIFLNLYGEILEFDYTIPAGYLETTKSSIKASIGSIKLM